MRSQLPAAIIGHLDRWADLCNSQWEFVGDPHRGLSSSVVYCIKIGADRFALRNWNWTVDRTDALLSKLQFQQRLAQQWSPGLLIDSNSNTDCPIPLLIDRWADGQMIGEGDRTLWSLCTWRRGAPVSGDFSTQQWESIAQALAKMHHISLANGAAFGKSPGWHDRLERLVSIATVLGQSPAPETKVLANRTDSIVEEFCRAGHIQHLMDWVRPQTTTVQPACWIVRDAHQENWLVDGERVSGFVDFGAARCDWPFWDVVRLLTSANVREETGLQFFESYCSALPNGELARAVRRSVEELLDLQFWNRIDFLQQLLSVMQWRTWSSQKQIWPKDQLQRWDGLLERLQALRPP